jgi:isomerase DpgB
MSDNFLDDKNTFEVSIEIDGGEPLSGDLITRIEHAINLAEDSSHPVRSLLIRICGHEDAPSLLSWPGECHVQPVSKWERALRRLERTSVPVFVLAHQACSPIALEVLLVADYRVATQSFLMPARTSGVATWPGMSLYRLTRQIGEARARRFLITSSPLTASLALQTDIIDYLANDLDAALKQLEFVLAQAPLDDFAVRRRLMQDSADTSFDEALGAHLAACHRALQRRDSGFSSRTEEALNTSSI